MLAAHRVIAQQILNLVRAVGLVGQRRVGAEGPVAGVGAERLVPGVRVCVEGLALELVARLGDACVGVCRDAAPGSALG